MKRVLVNLWLGQKKRFKIKDKDTITDHTQDSKQLRSHSEKA